MTTPPRTVLLIAIVALALLQLYAGMALRECQKSCNYAIEQAETARLEVFEALHPLAKTPPTPPKEPKND